MRDAAAQRAALHIDHFYVEPAHQSQGIGAWVMGWAKAQADLSQLPLALAALRHSDTLRFYARHGLLPVSEGEIDIELRRAPAASPRDVLHGLWDPLPGPRLGRRPRPAARRARAAAGGPAAS